MDAPGADEWAVVRAAIKDRRLRAGYSQRDLHLKINLSEGYISGIETVKDVPSLKFCQRFDAALPPRDGERALVELRGDVLAARESREAGVVGAVTLQPGGSESGPAADGLVVAMASTPVPDLRSAPTVEPGATDSPLIVEPGATDSLPRVEFSATDSPPTLETGVADSPPTTVTAGANRGDDPSLATTDAGRERAKARRRVRAVVGVIVVLVVGVVASQVSRTSGRDDDVSASAAPTTASVTTTAPSTTGPISVATTAGPGPQSPLPGPEGQAGAAPAQVETAPPAVEPAPDTAVPVQPADVTIVLSEGFEAGDGCWGEHPDGSVQVCGRAVSVATDYAWDGGASLAFMPTSTLGGNSYVALRVALGPSLVTARIRVPDGAVTCGATACTTAKLIRFDAGYASSESGYVELAPGGWQTITWDTRGLSGSWIELGVHFHVPAGVPFEGPFFVDGVVVQS